MSPWGMTPRIETPKVGDKVRIVLEADVVSVDEVMGNSFAIDLDDGSGGPTTIYRDAWCLKSVQVLP